MSINLARHRGARLRGRVLLWIGLAMTAQTLIVAGVNAQATYPNRPITVVVGYPPGGSTDLTGRTIADQLSKKLGVPVIDPSIAALKRAEYAAVLKRQCGWVPSRRWSSESPSEEELALFGQFDTNQPFGNRVVVEAA